MARPVRAGERNAALGRLRPPLLVLAPPRSFTSVVSAMLGQHPQMYAFLETHLFVADDMADLLRLYRVAGGRRQHGLLRVVAELLTGDQTEESITLARRWCRSRFTASTADLFYELAAAVEPLVVVEKSVSTVWRREYLERAGRVLPSARFVHLTRHPMSHCESVLQALEREPWLARHLRADGDPRSPQDPQHLWLRLHQNILDFLSTIPPERQRRLAGEDVLSDPDDILPELVRWLGLDDDDDAVREMKHPERSPFAGFGPIGARFGNDPKFLAQPSLRNGRSGPGHRLDAPVPWRDDGDRLLPEVIELAREFGYE
jgi:hypothetical protein